MSKTKRTAKKKVTPQPESEPRNQLYIATPSGGVRPATAEEIDKAVRGAISADEVFRFVRSDEHGPADTLMTEIGPTLAEEEALRGKPVFAPLRPKIMGRPSGAEIDVDAGMADELLRRLEDRDDFIDELRAIRTARQKQYGSPIEDFTRTAKMWNALLGVADLIQPEHVALMMICLKLSRAQNRYSRDNMIDVAGYAITFEDVINELR